MKCINVPTNRLLLEMPTNFRTLKNSRDCQKKKSETPILKMEIFGILENYKIINKMYYKVINKLEYVRLN